MIYSRLKDLKAFEKFHPLLLQQICYYSYYEDLEEGIILFRQGDVGTNWYAVLSGSLDMNVSETNDTTKVRHNGAVEDCVTLCTLGVGTAFGESILNDTPRHSTVVTREYCELLRVEQKDFKILWERNKQLMQTVLSPYAASTDLEVLSTLRKVDLSSAAIKSSTDENRSNPAAPIAAVPSETMIWAAKTLRTAILNKSSQLISDRKLHIRVYRRCMVGCEMVDWFLQYNTLIQTRTQATNMWQALLEEGVLIHVCREHYFKDSNLFYRFEEDDQSDPLSPSQLDRKQADEELLDVLVMLSQIAPDAMMRTILRKLLLNADAYRAAIDELNTPSVH